MYKKENIFRISINNEHEISIIENLENTLAKSLVVGFLVVSLFLGLIWNFLIF